MSIQNLIEEQTNDAKIIQEYPQLQRLESPYSMDQVIKVNSSNYDLFLGNSSKQTHSSIIRRVNLSQYQDNQHIKTKYSSPRQFFSNQYHRLFISRIDDYFFATYHIERHSTILSLYQITPKGVKRICKMKLGSFVVNLFENALLFLGEKNKFKCIFLASDGQMRLIDLLKRKVIDSVKVSSPEEVQYNKDNKMIFIKQHETLKIYSLIKGVQFSEVILTITGQESFEGTPEIPKAHYCISQYKDLKTYYYDHQKQILFVIYGWITVDVRMVGHMITTVRVQEWKLNQNIWTLIQQSDCPWKSPKTSQFYIDHENYHCLVYENGMLSRLCLKELIILEKKRYSLPITCQEPNKKSLITIQLV